MTNRPKLSGKQRAELDRLEAADALTPYQRGKLIAWSQWYSADDADRASAVLTMPLCVKCCFGGVFWTRVIGPALERG
jgi:hypothetical protein